MVERKTKKQLRDDAKRALAERAETAHLRQPPDCIIIGAQKGGTTSLVRHLSKHPDVGVSIRGEDHFFAWQQDEGHDWSWYVARFPLRGEVQAVVVSSPSYLFDPRAAARVRAALPEVKLIALLRNPIDRAYSQHQMNVRKGIEPLSFEEAIVAEPERLRDNRDWSDAGWRHISHLAYLGRGLYAEQLQRWLAHFPRAQILVLKSEEFFQRPDEGLRQTLAFLGLAPWHPDRYEVYNPGAYDAMLPKTRRRLHEYFAPHNRALYELLDCDLGWETDG